MVSIFLFKSYRACSEDILGLGQVISFIANEGKFKFNCEHSIQNSIYMWPGMIRQSNNIDSTGWVQKNGHPIVLE